MRRIIRMLHGVYKGFLWAGDRGIHAIMWLKYHWILLGIVGVLLIGATLSVILPMCFPHVPFLLIYLGTIAFAVLALGVVFAVAMDRIAETIGTLIKVMALLRQNVSALHQATLKSNNLMEQNLHLQNALIGKLNETETAIQLATDKMVATAGDTIRALQSH